MNRHIEEIRRGRNLRSIKKNVYISCEGKTEKAYLVGLKKQFSQKVNIKISYTNKTNAKDIVKNLKSKFKSEYEKDDLRYCIFDCDENSSQDLLVAKELATRENAKIIFSNPCFEIWLLWHFENNFSYQNSRDKLKKLIENYIRPAYWTLNNNPNLYEFIKEHLKTAQMNYYQRKEQLERENINWYSRESNPFSNLDDLYSDLAAL